MSVVGCLGGKVSSMFQVALCVVRSLSWQCVLLGFLGANVCCFVF